MRTRLSEPHEVDRTRSRRVAREHALVLSARGISYEQHREGSARVLWVERADADEARRQLARFDEENRNWPPEELDTPLLTSGGFAAVAYLLTLAMFHIAGTGFIPIVDWAAAGQNDSTRVLQGEWWRPVTALTLHADVIHLAGNLLFGAVFVAAVCQLVGSGVGLLAILLSGAAGNWINVLVRGPGHLSLGASTAVFGAVALLVSIQWCRREGQGRGGRARRWTLLAAGLAFLGFLGMSGERTDVPAHVAGFLAGLLVGLLLELGPWRNRFQRAQSQGLAILALLALLLLSWGQAIRFGA